MVLESGFCLAKGITDIESKGVYAGDIINKRRYWKNEFCGGLIDNHFQYKEVSYVGMLQARNHDKKSIQIIIYERYGLWDEDYDKLDDT